MAMTREESNAYMRGIKKARYYRIKAELIDNAGGKCVKCGSTDNLEFDHIDPSTKTIDVTEAISLSLQVLAEEVKKCQLLCRKCHVRKSILENGNSPAPGTHGTLSAYRYCKCELCKAAKREWMRAYAPTRNAKRREKYAQEKHAS